MDDARVIERAMACLADIDASGELPLSVRQRLMRTLREMLGDQERMHAFVALLGLKCAKRAWPVWNAAFPDEPEPVDVADRSVASVVEGRESVSVTKGEIDTLKTHLDNKFLLGEERFPAIYAGFASWAVARDVSSPEDGEKISGNSELEVDPQDWEPCFLASLAITGGAVWDGIVEARTRREFWAWYLTSAVPQAFDEASRPK